MNKTSTIDLSQIKRKEDSIIPLHIPAKKSIFSKNVRIKDNNSSKNGVNAIFKKFFLFGETMLSKLPLKKILPIFKRSSNRNFLWIIFFVIRFVKILKQRTFVERYNKLNQNHFNLIHDNVKLPGDTNQFLQRLMTRNKNLDIFKKKVYIYYFFK